MVAQLRETLYQMNKDDVVCTLVMFKEDYVTFPGDAIAKISSLTIPINKRNWRKEDWRNKDGRPVDIGTPQSRVQEWRQQHPEGHKPDCRWDMGFDLKTIRKW